MNAVQANKQISLIITEFVKNNVCVDQNFPSIKDGVIGLGQSEISHMLKDEPYVKVYRQCAERRDFHLCLLDGALIQFQYFFDVRGKELIRHRLAYMPHPELESYCENAEYEDDWLSDLLFSDIRSPSSIQFPIRFDFDCSEKKHREKWHSKAHLTLGNVEGCRIPAVGPISPFRFIDFILRCFYSKKYETELQEFICEHKTEQTLTGAESKLVHLSFSPPIGA